MGQRKGRIGVGIVTTEPVKHSRGEAETIAYRTNGDLGEQALPLSTHEARLGAIH
jgi:hypothetical protein